jgi:hypothetical protein
MRREGDQIDPLGRPNGLVSVSGNLDLGRATEQGLKQLGHICGDFARHSTQWPGNPISRLLRDGKRSARTGRRYGLGPFIGLPSSSIARTYAFFPAADETGRRGRRRCDR